MRLRLGRKQEPADERWSCCYAPHSSMYFDQFGKVRACCQNTGVYLGDVAEQTLREIWESADAEHLRSALEADDYGAGCDFCEWQVREGNDSILFARQFDELRPDRRRPRWPRQMEFSLTNTCNLACAMCNGDWSSTIRAKREGRPAIPVIYHDTFFEQLAEFLPHLDGVAFLGGEPFLGKEPLRVMEMIAELDRPPRVTITTNGTVYTDRVRRIIDLLEPNIVVSIDGASTDTYDAIRVGAHLPDVLANLDRYREAVGPAKVSITHCLMTSNWHEFADLLAIAEERDMAVGVNVVRFPEAHSLYHLEADRLRPIVETLQATETPRLTGRRLDKWQGHVAALAHRLEAISGGSASDVPGAPKESLVSLPVYESALGQSAAIPRPWLPFALGGTATDPLAPIAQPGPAGLVHIDLDGTVTVRRLDDGLPVDLADIGGQHIDALSERLEAVYGPGEFWTVETPNDDRLVVHASLAPGEPGLLIHVDAERDSSGRLTGGNYLFHPSPGTPDESDSPGRAGP